MKLFSLIILFIFSSCSSYVQNLQNQITREEMKTREVRRQRYLRYKAAHTPKTLSIASKNTARSKNQFKNIPTKSKKRVKAEDLKDNDSSGSLWTGDQHTRFLFASSTRKREGDIVIINVYQALKKTITRELELAFPKRRYTRPVTTASRDNKKDGKTMTSTPTPSAATTTSEEEESNDPKKVYDKISTKIVELIQGNYALIRGRKEVMFQKKKRFIEIQGIIFEKDINSENYVSSDKLLEQQITVLEY